MKRVVAFSLMAGAAICIAGGTLVANSFAEPTNPALQLAMKGSAKSLFASDGETEDGKSFVSISPRERAVPLFEFREASVRPIQALDWRNNQPFEEPRHVGLEFALNAPAEKTGLGVDLSIAPRAGLALGPEGGQIRSTGAEVRLGQRLRSNLRSVVDVGKFEPATWDRPAWYFFAATDGSALTWTPEISSAGRQRGFAYQDERVVVGDAQVGFSVEARGMQASLTVVNREVSNGQVSKDENFVGASLTMRR